MPSKEEILKAKEVIYNLTEDNNSTLQINALQTALALFDEVDTLRATLDTQALHYGKIISDLQAKLMEKEPKECQCKDKSQIRLITHCRLCGLPQALKDVKTLMELAEEEPTEKGTMGEDEITDIIHKEVCNMYPVEFMSREDVIHAKELWKDKARTIAKALSGHIGMSRERMIDRINHFLVDNGYTVNFILEDLADAILKGNDNG